MMSIISPFFVFFYFYEFFYFSLTLFCIVFFRIYSKNSDKPKQKITQFVIDMIASYEQKIEGIWEYTL